MSTYGFRTIRVLLGALCVLASASFAHGQDDAQVSEIRKRAEQLVQQFNAGKADEVAAAFLKPGELIDEAGTVYQGQPAIKELLTTFFERFPGAKLSLNIESIRLVGPVAIDEGTRTITAADGQERSHFRYIAIWAKTDKAWQLASFRDFADDPTPTANENLQPLAWLVGDWVNEGVDGTVNISYRWSDDKNYLLGDFEMKSGDGDVRKTSQRIGWDPAQGKIRSWLFDADGGFAEGLWTITDEGIVIKSSSVNPDGTSATATMNIVTQDNDHYSIQGTDRIVGDSLEEDFEITVARKPPVAGK